MPLTEVQYGCASFLHGAKQGRAGFAPVKLTHQNGSGPDSPTYSKGNSICRSEPSVDLIRFELRRMSASSLRAPMGMAFSWRGCSLPTIPPVGRRSPLLRTRGYVILSENRGGSVGRAFDSDRCVVGPSPTCGTEHFGFPPSAPRLGNQRPWYVQPRLCDWAYERYRATYRKEKGIVSRWSVSS